MKSELRKKIVALRDAMEEQEVIEKSKIICEGLSDYLLKEEIKTVMVYMPKGNEVNIIPMIKTLLAEKKRVAAPICIGKGIMIASVIENLDTDLVEGVLGILAPKEERPVAPEEIDAVIVPGLGFDAKGNRLGFGGGFYDRFLPKMREDAKKIAVCFDCQIFEALTPDPWDFVVDVIISNEKTYKIK